MALGRPIPTLHLSREERETLERWARRPTSAQALSQRARIVLACAQGISNTQVAQQMHLSQPTVGKWRDRFVAQRLDGLRDEPRPGAPRKIGDAEVERALTLTLEERPSDATHWSTRSMARRSGLSQSAVSRIWRAFALQPHRAETFQLSKDPLFIEKVRDIVGLYLKPRDKVVVMTKSDTRDPAGMKADLDRYRRELGTDYIDIVLMHCMMEGDWTTRYRGTMDVLSEAKEKGILRAHGCSCHTLEALRAAAASPWVEVDLVRMNPVGAYMDSDPKTVAQVIQQMRASGKGIVGMKILGQGKLRHRQSKALHYALSLGLLDAFTIGAASKDEQMDLIGRIATA